MAADRLGDGGGPTVRFVEATGRRLSRQITVASYRTYADAGFPLEDVVYPSGTRFSVRGVPAGTGDSCTVDDGYPELPINCVTWETAMAVCAFLGSRLPTEAEWERVLGGVPGPSSPGTWDPT